MSFEDSGIMGEQSAIAAIAVFRKLATLCAPDSAAPCRWRWKPFSSVLAKQRRGRAKYRSSLWNRLDFVTPLTYPPVSEGAGAAPPTAQWEVMTRER